MQPQTTDEKLDAIAGTLKHAVVIIESVSRRVDQLDDGALRAEKLDKVARRLATTAARLLTARAVAKVVPTGSRLLALAGGSFAGAFAAGLVAAWWWYAGHPVPTAVAALLP